MYSPIGDRTDDVFFGVYVGLQDGTPISKRMSWNEYFKHPFWEIKEEERLELLQKKIRRKKTLLGTFKLQSPNPNTAEGGEEKKEEVIKNGNMGEIYESSS